MDEDDSLLKIKVSIGIIIAADDLEVARDLIREVSNLCRRMPGLTFIHKDVSADRLWLKRGAGP